MAASTTHTKKTPKMLSQEFGVGLRQSGNYICECGGLFSGGCICCQYEHWQWETTETQGHRLNQQLPSLRKMFIWDWNPPEFGLMKKKNLNSFHLQSQWADRDIWWINGWMCGGVDEEAVVGGWGHRVVGGRSARSGQARSTPLHALGQKGGGFWLSFEALEWTEFHHGHGDCSMSFVRHFGAVVLKSQSLGLVWNAGIQKSLCH